jgi:anaerobic selenocysteine-containing dehydrogenase
MKLTRREFLALSGKAAAGTVIFAACGIPERELIVQSPVELPEDLVRGEDAWYATVNPDGRNGDGLIVRVMQGRAKKVAGNPDFPVNLGKHSPREDASLQFLYHPDRIAGPLFRRTQAGALAQTTWIRAEVELERILGASRITVVTNPLRGHLGWVARRFAEVKGGRYMTFDPVEQGALHGAVKKIFDADVLPDFDIEHARTVLSFGADWLSTWVSPTRFAVQFGKFRSGEERGFLIHGESRMSMTAANADLWLPAKPGTEGDIALAIANVIIDEGLASQAEVLAFTKSLPSGVLNGYRPADVAARSGVAEEKIVRAARRFGSSRPSVAFGGGSAGAHVHGSFALSAIYALNTLVSAVGAEGGVRLNPASPVDGLSGSATGSSFAAWEEELAQWRAGNVDTVVIRGVDIVHGMPNSVDIKGALARVPNIVVFGTVMDDTAAAATLVLPEKTYLEDWGTDIPEPAPGYQVVSFQQPVVGPTIAADEKSLIADARSFGDELLRLAGSDIGASSMQQLVTNTSDGLFNANRANSSVRAPNSSLFRNGVMQRGGWWDTSAKAPSRAYSFPSFFSGKTAPEFSETGSLGAGLELNLVPFVSNNLLDGRLAAAPWAQQVPDPMSSAAWTTWAEINKKDAEELGVSEGDVLFIKSASGEIEALAYPHPGAPRGVVGVPIGYGKTEGGRWAEGLGENVLGIIAGLKDEESGALAWAATKVRVQKSGRKMKLSKFEGHVEAYPVEPGVPALIVAPGETAEEAEEANHHEYQKLFLNEESRREAGFDNQGDRISGGESTGGN